MPSFQDYLPAHLKTSSISEGVMGAMTSVNPLGRILQLAGVTEISEVDDSTSQVIQEADASGAIDQLVASASNLPQYKGNAEAARLYTIGSVLSALFQNIQKTPPQTTAGQAKMQELTVLGAMGADLIKTSQDMVKPATTQPQVSPQAATPT